MTSLHGAIRELLLADAPLSALVLERIYPLRMPMNTILPALTIHKISDARNHITGHGYPRYQISCWGATFAEVHTVADAVIECLHRYKGVASDNFIKQISYQDSHDAIEEDPGIFHIPVDFKIIHYTP